MRYVTFDVAYLARHGQTEWNSEGRRQGQLDSPLTAEGRKHASGLACLAATLDVDLVATSPLGRARATAQTCAEVLGLTILVIDELAEVHHGQMAGLTTAQAQAQFPEALEQRLQDKYRWRFPDGESYADADERAAVALDQIVQADASRPLIVSHEMIGRMLLRNLISSEPDAVLSTQQPHHVVYRVIPSAHQVHVLNTTTVQRP